MIIGASVFHTFGRLGSIEGENCILQEHQFLSAVEQILDMGYKQIELPADHLLMAFNQEQLGDLVEKLAKIGRRRGTSWSVHLPFLWIDGSCVDENIRQASVKTHLDFINTTEVLEPTHYVLHSITDMSIFRNSNISQDLRDKYMARVVDAAKKTAEQLVNVLKTSDRLCIENLTEMDFRWDLEVVKESGAAICLDIGHHFHRGGDPVVFLEEHFSRIKCIHAHNVVPTISEQNAMQWKAVDHFGLHNGLINIERFLERLVDRQYSGALIAEVRGLAEGQQSTEFLKRLGLFD